MKFINNLTEAEKRLIGMGQRLFLEDNTTKIKMSLNADIATLSRMAKCRRGKEKVKLLRMKKMFVNARKKVR